MTTPTVSLISSIGDLSNMQLTDALGFPISQPIALAGKYKMTYNGPQNDANNTTTVPSWYYEGTHSITIASSTYDVDISLLADAFGNLLVAKKIYKIVIVNNDVSGGSGLKIGGAASNAWTALFDGSTTAKHTIAPGGRYVNENPYAGFSVTGGSKVLRFTNDAASPSGAASFNMHLWGS